MEDVDLSDTEIGTEAAEEGASRASPLGTGAGKYLPGIGPIHLSVETR